MPVTFNNPYDQLVNRRILSQFTTRGLDDPTQPFYNCEAVSKTPDPTGEYCRYAFITQPDPFGRIDGFFDRYGISMYALEKSAPPWTATATWRSAPAS